MRRELFKDTHIDRRGFLKGIGALGVASALPFSLKGADLDYGSIEFDASVYEKNNPQTIIVYLYGGPSELAGNLTNLEEIDEKSQNRYPLDEFTATPNRLWRQAGGDIMESLISSGDMNLFRTCYRTVDDNKAHGECTSQAQRGRDIAGGAGIVANLAAVLYNKGVIGEPAGTDDIGKSIPFVTMEGESTFFSEDDLNLAAFLKPVAFGTGSNNPYKRGGWFSRRVLNRENNATVGDYFDALAQKYNSSGKIRELFERRVILEEFADRIHDIELPEGVEYPSNNTFADRMKLAMNLLIHNEHTKVVSMGSPGLGGWDDHSNALERYPRRMNMLMEAVEAAVAHMKAAGKTNINIVIFGEFGRNVSYNNSDGWDHGNNQNVYWIGGRDYMNRLGIVGETQIIGSAGRLFTQPKNFGNSDSSYHFQVFSIAATVYKMYGIQNPEILTHGNGAIRDLLS